MTKSEIASGVTGNRPSTRKSGQLMGLWAAIGAFSMWGVLPIYWKMLDFLPPLVITLHRVLWSFCFLLLLLLKAGKLRSSLAYLKHKRTAVIVTLCSLVLSCNWLIFIWAVNNGHIVESSLGYFLNPLLNMLFGVIFFRERPDFLQWLAIFLACLGVAVQVFMFGRLPWIALSLGLSFATYGVLRKTETIESTPGLFLETVILAPLVTAALVWFWYNGDTSFTASIGQSLFIMCSGVITSIPLILFAYSAQQLSLTTVGLCQYISPSATMLIGIFLYGEQVTAGHMLSFGLIWAALAVYTFESVRLYRQAARLRRS